MKKLLKSIIPPIFLDILKKLKISQYGWQGNFSSWDEVKTASTGYDTSEILTKVRNSLLKVKEGEAAYERDSVLFDEIEYSWPLLSGLMFVAAKSCGILKVLDFGGSLGSTYFQNKKFLDNLSIVSWNIVEQKRFVEVGKMDFENKYLNFYYDVKTCQEEKNPNTLVLSSVLQYIEEPYKLLDDILEYEFEYILIDRTPFSTQGVNKIKIQNVPPSIYRASYPCHFFNQDYFESYFVSKKYKLIEKFNALDGCGTDYQFKGLILKKVNNV